MDTVWEVIAVIAACTAILFFWMFSYILLVDVGILG